MHGKRNKDLGPDLAIQQYLRFAANDFFLGSQFWIESDLYELPADPSYDLVWSQGLIEHEGLVRSTW